MKRVCMFLIFTAGIISFTLYNGSFAQNTQGEKITLGPYLQQMTPKSVTIAWATKTGETLVGSKRGQNKSVSRYEYHSTIISGLTPDTEYSYDVLGNGSDDGKGTFRTFPYKIQPFHFCVLGDTRSRHDVHRQVVNRIIEEKPLFVVNTGDLVGNGNNISDWEHFFEINKELIKNVPYYTVLGNHEKDSKNYYNFFTLPGNERYYFFTVGNALFIVLDMEGPDYQTPSYLSDEGREIFWNEIGKKYFDEEKEWLEHLLNVNNEAGFIFVFFHPTWYSIKSSRVEEAKQRREYWGDIFERHHVQVVLNGHDHYYHHAEHGGTHYIVTAGGGAPLYDTDAIQPETVKYKKIEHYMRINVGLNEAVLKAIQLDGEVIERIVVHRRNKTNQ